LRSIAILGLPEGLAELARQYAVSSANFNEIPENL
jgi:hypothetical protein